MKNKYLKDFKDFKTNESFFGAFFRGDQNDELPIETYEDETAELSEVPEIQDVIRDEIQEETPQYNNINMTPRDFSIVKIMTSNGEKVAMCYSTDCSEYGSQIFSNLDFRSAAIKVEEISKLEGIGIYDIDKDSILGAVPKYLIPKKPKETGSYRIKESIEDVAIFKDKIKQKREEVFTKIEELEKRISNISNDSKMEEPVKEEQISILELQLESLKNKFKFLIRK